MALQLNTERFKLVGGNVSVDFVNTVSGRVSNPNKKSGRDYMDLFRTNKINNYADLVAFSLKAELITEKAAKHLLQLATKESAAAEKVWQRAMGLRESIYRLFKSVIEDWQPEGNDLENLNRELGIARIHQRLSFANNEFGFEWLDRAKTLDSMLWQIAEAAAALLATGDLTRIRQCGGEGCYWLFLDTSRNRSRHWCDLKDCGNVAKVRRFRQKHQDKN